MARQMVYCIIPHKAKYIRRLQFPQVMHLRHHRTWANSFVLNSMYRSAFVQWLHSFYLLKKIALTSKHTVVRVLFLMAARVQFRQTCVRAFQHNETSQRLISGHLRQAAPLIRTAFDEIIMGIVYFVPSPRALVLRQSKWLKTTWRNHGFRCLLCLFMLV